MGLFGPCLLPGFPGYQPCVRCGQRRRSPTTSADPGSEESHQLKFTSPITARCSGWLTIKGWVDESVSRANFAPTQTVLCSTEMGMLNDFCSEHDQVRSWCPDPGQSEWSAEKGWMMEAWIKLDGGKRRVLQTAPVSLRAFNPPYSSPVRPLGKQAGKGEGGGGCSQAVGSKFCSGGGGWGAVSMDGGRFSSGGALPTFGAGSWQLAGCRGRAGTQTRGLLRRLAESGKEPDLAPHHTSPPSSSLTREELTQAGLGPSFLRIPWQPESPHKRADLPTHLGYEASAWQLCEHTRATDLSVTQFCHFQIGSDQCCTWNGCLED